MYCTSLQGNTYVMNHFHLHRKHLYTFNHVHLEKSTLTHFTPSFITLSSLPLRARNTYADFDLNKIIFEAKSYPQQASRFHFIRHFNGYPHPIWTSSSSLTLHFNSQKLFTCG